MTIKSIQSPGSSHSGSPTGLNSFSSEKLANTNSMYSPVSSLATNGQALQVAQSQSERSSLGLNGHHLNPWASGVTSTAADWYPQMGQYPQYPYSNAAIHDPYQNQVKNKFNSHTGGWQTMGRKINFVGNCIADSTAYFFIIILCLIFTPFIEIKIKKNTSLVQKICSRRPILDNYWEFTKFLQIIM